MRYYQKTNTNIARDSSSR